MAEPTTAIERWDLSMSYAEFNEMMNQRKFIGMRVLPPVGVAKQSGSFLRLPIEAFLDPIEDTKRAPNGTYARDTFEWEPDSFETEEHGVEESVDDRRRKIYGDLLKTEMICARRAVNRVAQRYEYDAAAALFNATTFKDYTTAVSVPWTTGASATPIANIDAGKESVLSQVGVYPNALILSDYALLKMVRTDEITGLLKYSGRDDPKTLIPGLKELFQIEQIIVSKASVKNTANKGQDATISRLWDTTMASLACIADGGDQDLESTSPCLGRTIMWNDENAALPGAEEGEMNLIVEEYREESRRGDVIRARGDYQIKIIHTAAAHLLTAVTA